MIQQYVSRPEMYIYLFFIVALLNFLYLYIPIRNR